MSPPGLRYLIAIGSPKSPGMGLNPLPNVAKDVERITTFFTSPEQGYHRVLAESIPLEASAQSIRNQLEEWFGSDERRESDCVIIYYAGHGEETGKFRRHYLLTSDTHPRKLVGTAIETGELPKIMFEGEGQRPQSVLLILDTCYSGEGGGQAAAALGQVKAAALGGLGAGMYIVSSAGPADRAGDGAFVTAFLDALNDPVQLGRGGAEYLNPIDVCTEANIRLRASGQQAEADVIRGALVRQTFIRNPFYSSLLTGTTLEDSQHWDIKARGVEAITQAGDFFEGRVTALAELSGWIASPMGDGRARVVTGKPGSGKSALLGRLFMRLGAGSAGKSIAIHAHRLNLAQVVLSACRQAGVAGADLKPLLKSLSQPGTPVPVILDALDEAQEPRLIEERLLEPLARIPRVRLLVGTRIEESGRVPLTPGAVEINLDAPKYFAESDIEGYVFRRLTAAESGLRPKAKDHELHDLAKRVALNSRQSFLYARTVSRWLVSSGMEIEISPGWLDRIQFPPGVTEAFGRDLDRFDADTRRRFIDLLIPLAYAQGKGLPQKTVWQRIATDVAGREYTNTDIRDLKQQAGYYVVRDDESGETVYRIFHEAFAKYLRDLSRDEDVELRMFESLRALVPKRPSGQADWEGVTEPYVSRYLALHALNAGRLPELIGDADYLLSANPSMLGSVLRMVPPDLVGVGTAYLRAYPHMRGRGLTQRVQQLALAAAVGNNTGLLDQLRIHEPSCDWFPVHAWYSDVGSHVISRTRDYQCGCLTVARDGVHKLIVVTDEGARVLSLSTGEELLRSDFAAKDVDSVISVSDSEFLICMSHKGGDVSVFDMTGQRQLWRQNANQQPHAAVTCLLTGRGENAIAAGAGSGQVLLYSIRAGELLASVRAHRSGVAFLSVAEIDGKAVLITGSDSYVSGRVVEDRQIGIWNVEKLRIIRYIKGEAGNIAQWAAVVTMGGHQRLVAYFYPKTGYHIFDPSSGKELASLTDVTSRPFGLLKSKDSTLIFSGFSDTFSAIEIAEGANGPKIHMAADLSVAGGQWFGPIAFGPIAFGPIASNARPLLVTASETVRVWDANRLTDLARKTEKPKVGLVRESGEPLFELAAPPTAPFVAGLSRFGNVRVWSDSGKVVFFRQLLLSLEDPALGNFDFLRMADFQGQTLIILAGKSGVVQALDLRGNPELQRLKINGPITAFAAYASETRLLAIAPSRSGSEYRVGVWNLVTGEELTAGRRFEMESYDKTVDFVVAKEWAGETVLTAAMGHSHYRRIASWKLSSLDGPPGWRPGRPLWQRLLARQIRCIQPVQWDLEPAIAAGDTEGSVTIVNSLNGEVLEEFESHDESICALQVIRTAGRELLVSAGREGTIMGRSTGSDGKLAFRVDVGDRINAMAAISGGRIAVGTEEGLLLFHINQNRLN